MAGVLLAFLWRGYGTGQFDGGCYIWSCGEDYVKAQLRKEFSAWRLKKNLRAKWQGYPTIVDIK